jgi:hypothetical protein
MSGCPTTPDRVAAAWCGRRGRSSPELRVTRLRCSVFVGFSSYGTSGCKELTKGVFFRWGLRSRTCGNKVQASTFGNGGGTLQGSAHDKVGPNGCGVERRTPASGRWSSRSIARGMAMKGANLGFVSVFFEIPARVPSIYRGLSPSFPIRLGFDILNGFVEILVCGVFVSVATRHGVIDDRC